MHATHTQRDPHMNTRMGWTMAVVATLRAQIQQYRAEARFLRALSYWHAIDMFGGVPLITENDVISATTPPQPVARDSIYRYLVSELTAIQSQLPAPSASSYARATP